MNPKDKELKFLDLMSRVHACERCPRMRNSAHVLGPGCGPLDARVIFIGEAPGRLGADGSELPFHGDRAGHNFESLIEQVGISRYEAFVTNAVLCNPKDEGGHNATPTAAEIANCAPFLREQLELIDPKIVVTLGAVALKACASVSEHHLTLKTSVRKKHRWFGRLLIPAYHPGQRAMMHRSFANQLADYQFVAEVMKRNDKKKIPSKAKTQRLRRGDEKLACVARRILRNSPHGVSYFALHKLYFLAEVAFLEKTGERLTNAYVIRQKDGPYCTGFHLSKLKDMLLNLVVYRVGHPQQIRLGLKNELQDDIQLNMLSSEELAAIDQTTDRYGDCSDAELKRIVYLSRPMRELLKKEKKYGMNLFNTPVLLYKKVTT